MESGFVSGRLWYYCVMTRFTPGLGNTIAPMYLSEIAPFNYRGAFGTLHQLLVTGGIFLSSVFGLKELLGTQPQNATSRTGLEISDNNENVVGRLVHESEGYVNDT